MFEDLISAIKRLIGQAPEKIEKATEGEDHRKGHHAYGAVAVAKALKGADFPMSKNELMEKYGDKEVEYHIGGKEKLRDVLSNVPDLTYNTMTELEYSLHQSFLKSPEKTERGVYGAVAIAHALKGADFPMSKNELIEKYGDREVEYTVGRTESLHDILDELPDQEYNTINDLEQSFHESLKKHNK